MKFPDRTYYSFDGVRVYRWDLVLSLVCLFMAWFMHLAMAAEVRLAEKGRALLPVVVARGASIEMRQLASDLAGGLAKMTGGSFAIEERREGSGIILGTTDEWPGILPTVPKGVSSELAREDYVIRTESGRVLLIGRTFLAVQNAVWDFFYRLGFRQYFPGAKWEMWPQTSDLALECNVFERPDYAMRKLRLGALTWPDLRPAVEEWKRRNRAISGFRVAGSHVYQDIFQDYSDFFESHPETWSGDRRRPKLDASNPEVLERVALWVRDYVLKHPDADTVPMDPSDSGGWREDSPLGSPSNQAVTIANSAAKALQEVAPEKKMSMYAYYMHSAPPTIWVDKNVIVSVATAFIQGDYTAVKLLKGWHSQGAEVGVREYLGVAAWDYGMPRKARAADIDYIATSIPAFYQAGARYWDSEVSEAWGANGLGYFLAARFLWDTKEVARKDVLLDEFYQRAFGGSASTMKKFFETCLLKSDNTPSNIDLVERMVHLLNEALTLEQNPEVTSRILDFVLYTRYVELMLNYRSGGKTKEDFSKVVSLVEGNHESMMFNQWAIVREIPGRDFQISKKDMKAWLQPMRDQAVTFTSDQIRALVQSGAKKYLSPPFEVVSFSDTLRPVAFEDTLHAKRHPIYIRGNKQLILYSETSDPTFEFQVTSGATYRQRGSITLNLYAEANTLANDPVASVTLASDGEEHEVRLSSSYRGQHTLDILDPTGAGYRMIWPEGQRTVFPVSEGGNPYFVEGTYPWVFYVPKGTHVVGGYSANTSGKVITSSGQTIYDFSEMSNSPGYFSIAVPNGEDGTWWEIRSSKGKKLLMTVPSYLSRSPNELLIPEDKPRQGN